MKKLFISLALILSFLAVMANDGAFYSEGTHLIPITETDISVQKEILTITRVQGDNSWNIKYNVNVYYEFFNPGKAKDLIVGFESMPPGEGTIDDSYPYNPEISNFKVIMNGAELPYEASIVPFEGKYYQDGEFQELSLEYVSNFDEYFYYGNLFFVYHFNAHFNEGLNIINHTYTFYGEAYILSEYIFDYVLTAANRWANNGIDDFTLILDMGDRQSFCVAPTFFNGTQDWTIDGKGRVKIDPGYISYVFECDNEEAPVFHIQQGKVVFHKKNFHPEGELYIHKKSSYLTSDIKELAHEQYLSISSELITYLDDSELTKEDRRIMKNLPFAYRGYVFKNKKLQEFFESADWYIPNPEYKDDINGLSDGEKDWINFWSK